MQTQSAANKNNQIGSSEFIRPSLKLEPCCSALHSPWICLSGPKQPNTFCNQQHCFNCFNSRTWSADRSHNSTVEREVINCTPDLALEVNVLLPLQISRIARCIQIYAYVTYVDLMNLASRCFFVGIMPAIPILCLIWCVLVQYWCAIYSVQVQCNRLCSKNVD